MAGGSALSHGAAFIGYNVVVTGLLTDSSHIQGTSFVNNLNAVNVPIFAQSTQAGTGDTLTVAGAISGSTVTLERGVYRYQQSATPAANLNGGSTRVQDASVSIADLAAQISAASSYYPLLPSSTAVPNNATLAITASGTGLSVFQQSASSLTGANENITLTAAPGQTIVIVVPDSSVVTNSSGHLTLGGSTSASQILWDFPNATSISLNDSLWVGSILAPNATLTDNNQNINGGVYVQNFVQTAEVHLSDAGLAVGAPQFSGPVSVPEPASVLLLGLTSFAVLRRKGR